MGLQYKDKQTNGKKRILIVDNEQEIVEMIKIMIESEGFQGIEAYNRKMALDHLKNSKQNEVPDLILLDIVMKPLNGWQILGEIKSDEKLKNIPVSMLTLVPLTPEVMEREDIENIEDYITKPFTKDELIKKINEIFIEKKEYEEQIRLLERYGKKKLAYEYLELRKKLSRHKRLKEALEMTSDNVMAKKDSMRSILNREKNLISEWEKEIKDYEGKTWERNK